ncbi:FIST N-terminal domain-containing protein [soil metagenome]
MNSTAVVSTTLDQGAEAGAEIGHLIREQFGGENPDAVLLFASPVYKAAELLSAFHETCQPGVLVGCSSAGEFTEAGPLSSSAVALAIKSDKYRFAVREAHDIQADLDGAATSMAESFGQADDLHFPYRTALVLMDTLAGYGEEFLQTLAEKTRGRYQIVGGGAADDAAFKETFVFANDQVMSDAAVALEIQSVDPVGIGVSHGWTPASHPMTVTGSSGLLLTEINRLPAAEVIEAFAEEHNHAFDRTSPLPFFLHHVLGITSGDDFKLRVPLAVSPEGALICAAEVPTGSTIRIMRTSDRSAADAARVAARRAWNGLKGREPGVALFFDCAATRLRLGDSFGDSVDEILGTLGIDTCVGCNTYGQFAQAEGQFGGFHNCTAVVCVLPE